MQSINLYTSFSVSEYLFVHIFEKKNNKPFFSFFMIFLFFYLLLFLNKFDILQTIWPQDVLHMAYFDDISLFLREIVGKAKPIAICSPKSAQIGSEKNSTHQKNRFFLRSENFLTSENRLFRWTEKEFRVDLSTFRAPNPFFFHFFYCFVTIVKYDQHPPFGVILDAKVSIIWFEPLAHEKKKKKLSLGRGTDHKQYQPTLEIVAVFDKIL